MPPLPTMKLMPTAACTHLQQAVVRLSVGDTNQGMAADGAVLLIWLRCNRKLLQAVSWRRTSVGRATSVEQFFQGDVCHLRAGCAPAHKPQCMKMFVL